MPRHGHWSQLTNRSPLALALVSQLLVLTALAAPVLAADSSAAKVIFELVPENAWSAGRPDLGAALDGGRVYLYRSEEDAEPDLVVPAGEPAEIPPGDWSWIAEADGYVTTEGGVLRTGDQESAGAAKTVVWPVVPACRLTLTDRPGWRRIHRLDVVSQTRGATYPVHPRRRRELWVPAGRLLAYGVGGSGLIGIDRLRSCVAGETVELEPPSPPDSGHQDFLLTVHPPPSNEDTLFDSKKLVVALQIKGSSYFAGRSRRTAPTPNGLPAAPAAALWNPNRQTFFFLDVPSDEDLELVVRHPQARTVVEAVESLGGSARELEEVRLRERPDLAFLVDYQPAQEHQIERIEIAYCGLLPRLPRDPSSCRWLDREIPLRAGAHEVRVEDIDDGAYWVQARIDDESVFGLGHGVRPVLSPDDDQPEVSPEPLLLREFEVWGHILEGDEPVAGEAVLVPRTGDQPTRRFPTDGDLLYHLHYFGRAPWVGQVPEEDRDLDENELLGLYLPSYQLGACDEHSYCRYFNPHSSLRGGGRLDLPLGSGRRLEVSVVDAGTGEPIEGADVAAQADDRTLNLVDGEIEHGEPIGVEATVTLTDANGLARLRLAKSGGQDWVTVSKEGYGEQSRQFAAAPDEVTRLRVALTPDSDTAGVEIRGADGQPLSAAALLGFTADGASDPGCHLTTNLHGRAKVPERCARGRSYVVVHPEAALSVVPSERLTGSGAPIQVESTPRPPTRVRVIDGSGRPLTGVPIEIQLGPVLLDANDLLAASTKSGYMPFYLTGDDGELTLHGVDPNANPTPVLVSPIGPTGGTLSLAGYTLGDTVVFEVSADG